MNINYDSTISTKKVKGNSKVYYQAYQGGVSQNTATGHISYENSRSKQEHQDMTMGMTKILMVREL